MMAAEELGVPLDKVRTVFADTSTTGNNRVTAGSRTTFSVGMVIIDAARQAIAEMTRRAAKIWGVAEGGVVFDDIDLADLFGDGGPHGERASVPVASAGRYAALSAQARQAGMEFGVALVQEFHCDAYTALAACARALKMRYLESAALQALTPAFESITYPEADRRNLVVGRDAHGRLWCVLEDPFDRSRIDWAESRIGAPFTFALTVLDELRAYLKRHEASMRAIESALPDFGGHAGAQTVHVIQNAERCRDAHDPE
jgi:hypothetical protein